jgi:microcystin-dependent protein
MSEPFLGEIRMTSFAFAPRGWAFCNGQLLAISQNQALFALLGTQYGGNGQTTFALPDLRGRVPVHPGADVVQGQAGGATACTLTTAQLPVHSHTLYGSANQATTSNPAANVPAQRPRSGALVFGPTANAALAAVSLQPAAGAGQPHENTQPYLAISFVIALQGIFPSRN